MFSLSYNVLKTKKLLRYGAAKTIKDRMLY